MSITLYSLCSSLAKVVFSKSFHLSFILNLFTYTIYNAMQAGDGTAPAGAGGRPTFDQIIYMGLNSNPGKITVSLVYVSTSFVADK